MMEVFISHASEDKPIARRLEQDLKQARISVWIDHANIRVGDPLADRIQEAIENAPTLVLLWSASASASRYVKLEWQAAIHLGKAVLPCRLDQTELPVFLRTVLCCDFQDSYAQGLHQLVEALGGVLPLPRSQPHEQPPELAGVIAALHQAQQGVITRLLQQGPTQAAEVQARLDPQMEQALGVGGHDPMILNLAGYHKKNAYMIKHWAAIQDRRAPQDELLEEAERFFYSALSIQPNDPSALNGLGSVLMLRRDLDAAEFFIRRALARSQAQHIPYPAAKDDLQMVLRLKNELRG
jgi:hypothetical protein